MILTMINIDTYDFYITLKYLLLIYYFKNAIISWYFLFQLLRGAVYVLAIYITVESLEI